MDDPEGRARLTAAERAERRDQLSRVPGDRYQNLLYALRGGREVDLRQRRSGRLRWHPIAGTLLRVALVVVSIYLVASAGIRYVRVHQVDTWAGPTAGVTSGQQLEGCAAITGYDSVFPRWIRFEGHVYRATGYIRPIGFGPNASYPETGYTLGDLRLHRITSTPEGQQGRTIVLRLVSVPTGELYTITPECQ